MYARLYVCAVVRITVYPMGALRSRLACFGVRCQRL